MPGIGIGVGNTIGAQRALRLPVNDLSLRTIDRNGLTLPAVVGDDVEIIMPMPDLIRVENQINTTLDLSSVTDVDITSYIYKAAEGEAINQGSYDDNANQFLFTWLGADIYINVYNTTGGYGTFALTGNGVRKIRVKYLGTGDDNIDKLKCWVDDVPIEISFVGTLPSSLPSFTNGWAFGLRGPSSSYSTQGSIYDTSFTINGTLANKYPLCEGTGAYTYDVVGTAHGEWLFPNTSKFKYISGAGSVYALDNGFSIFRTLPDIIFSIYEYVPYDINGIPQSPTILSAYERVQDNEGSLTKHNLAHSKLVIASWDRSNETIFNDNARVLPMYDVLNPTWWNIGYGEKTAAVGNIDESDELNFDVLRSYMNPGHEGTRFLKVNDTSAYDRKFLREVISYSVDKTGDVFNQILRYTNDSNWYHTIDYSFSNISIRAQRDNKVLAFDYATKILSLSLDGGFTYPITKNLTGIVTTINDAWFYENGNITFAGDLKHYVSTDNLTTYQESTVLDINGDPFVPVNTYKNFSPVTSDYHQYVNGIEVRVWGNYMYNTTEVNVWFTKDNGLTLKSIYNILVSESPFAHTHAVNYNKYDNSFYFQFGEDANSTIVRAVPNATLDDWTFLTIGTGDAYYRLVGMSFYDGKVVYCGDSTTGSIAGRYGLWTLPSFSPTVFTDRIKANYLNNWNLTLIPTVFLYADPNGNLMTGIFKQKSIMTSINKGKYFMKHTLIGGPGLTESSNGYYNFLPKNSDGYYRADIFDDTEEISNGWVWEKGQVLMLKIVK
jgi:hypothetical protein